MDDELLGGSHFMCAAEVWRIGGSAMDPRRYFLRCGFPIDENERVPVAIPARPSRPSPEWRPQVDRNTME